nr:helix-turn-helix transcriptional regulator [uncultured Anaerosporobacter sp.]
MNYDLQKTAGIIKNLRRQRKMGQETVASDMGINIKTYQATEQGSRGVRIDTLCVIADYFHVTLDYLVTGKKSDNEWNKLAENLSQEQKNQLLSITSNVITTLGW